ncbi:MAG: ABC transporter ATP-binding protein [Thermoanaerobaculia bacterium]
MTEAEAPRLVAEGVGKKFCRDLRRSLAYGTADIFRAAIGRRRVAGLRPGEFWAVRDASFALAGGEALAVIGANGAGKTTLLRLLHGRLSLDAGTIRQRGRVSAIGDLGVGFDPLLSGRENARHAAAILDLPGGEIDRLLESIVEFAGIRPVFDSPILTYSSGMRARLGFAVAAHLDPDILLVDEALAVGDLAFRRKCIQHLAGFVERGRSLVLVSHDLYSAQLLCPRALLLVEGRIALDGPTGEAVARYLELQRADTAAPVPARPGAPAIDRPVTIEACEVVGESGGEPVTGRPMRIEVRYRSEREVRPVPWGFQIASADLMLEVATGVGALEEDDLALAAGRGTLACRVPRLPLLAGTYALRVAIADPHGRTVLALHGHHDPPTYFTVHAPPDETGKLVRLTGALVAVDTERAIDPR